MVTFNSYRVYKNAAGEDFLDLEVLLALHPQTTIMRFTFPATANNPELLKYLPNRATEANPGSQDFEKHSNHK